MGFLKRALSLLALDPGLGGVIMIGGVIMMGGGPDGVPGRRIPPHAALTGYATPWGWQPGLLDGGGPFVANLDLLPPEAQGVLAQRLDQGGCTLVASCAETPWAGLAERVAFLVSPACEIPAACARTGRRLGVAAAIDAIAAAAAAWGVNGHRAEAFCLRAALAVARAAGRRHLTRGDVAEAVALVLAPRARASHAPPPDSAEANQQNSATEQAEAPPLEVTPPPLPAAPVQTRPALHGAPAGSVPGRRRRGALDLPGTLLAALPWQRLRGATGLPPAIRPSDLRWHRHRPRQGRLVIFLVDSSGSMGARRLGQAKGAVLRLLSQAYRCRDQVALIAAGGLEPRLLLPPARAVARARRALTALPAGGGTPLAGALLLARRLTEQAHRQDGRTALLLLLTDGRANQPLRGGDRSAVREELKRCCLSLRSLPLDAAVLGESGPEARDLSQWLGAPLQRLHTPHATGR